MNLRQILQATLRHVPSEEHDLREAIEYELRAEEVGVCPENMLTCPRRLLWWLVRCAVR